MSDKLSAHEFRLSPHVFAILRGRGMCKNDRLLCSASRCRFQPAGCNPSSDFGRDIEIKGYGICPRCNAKVDWAFGIEWDDAAHITILKCTICKTRIPKRCIVWTQIVVSKHRKNKHYYYHKECYDDMFVDLPDDDVDEEILFCGEHTNLFLVRILKWTGRAEQCL